MSKELKAMLKQVAESDVTKTTHRKPYPALFPTRPELNQAGRVALVTGGGTNIGYAISRSFVKASADTLIIIGRRAEVLAKAASSLEEEGQTAGTKTKIIARTCDVSNLEEIDSLWKYVADHGIIVDVFVANAVKFTEPKPLLELGAAEIWSQFEANVKGPLYFTEKFCAQPGEKQKFIVNVTSQVIHMAEHPGVALRPGYTLTKSAATLFFQLIAKEKPVEKLQVISFHPGLIYNDEWKAMGLTPELFDTDDLSGSFAVWATSKEAQFLNGRFVWAAWDVEELATGEVRRRIDEDPYYLRASIIGLN